MIKKIIERILYPNTYSSDAYINYIRAGGGKVGRECVFFAPRTIKVDTSRLFLIELGDNVVLTAENILLTHDYSHTVLRKLYGENIGDAKRIKIGNNVFVGMRSIILMGTEIGNNTIIGAGAVVSGKFPDNVVIAGNPAKVICTIDELYERRKKKSVDCAIGVVQESMDKRGYAPSIMEMGDAFAWLYLEHTENTVNKYPTFFDLLGDNRNKIVDDFLNTKSEWNSYEDFLDFCNKQG